MNYLNICLKKMFLVLKRNVSMRHSFTHQKCIFDKKALIIIILGDIYFYVYLPIIRTFISSK